MQPERHRRWRGNKNSTEFPNAGANEFPNAFTARLRTKLIRKEIQGVALAGAGGIEPPNGGIKIRCLTAWLRPIRRTGIEATGPPRRFRLPHGGLQTRVGVFNRAPWEFSPGPALPRAAGGFASFLKALQQAARAPCRPAPRDHPTSRTIREKVEDRPVSWEDGGQIPITPEEAS
ncbi:hypothetical protein BRAS3843_3350002 [Bradyrhizobium sp. STM 3843]|nr:hypothetical protein BRAS3843_3350002 [Bradyrhizobium sp. STM 3843]